MEMRITWVTRSFLDYRIPVYSAINKLCDNKLTIIYFKDVVPERCQIKLTSILGDRAIGLTGELRLSGKKSQPLSSIKKNGIRIPFQPKLIKTIKNTSPVIILSDGFFQWTYAALWLRMFYKTPHIMLYEGTEHTERNAGRLRLTYRKLISKFINVIQCNGSLSHTFLNKVLKIKKSKLALGNMTSDMDVLKFNCYNCSHAQRLKFKQDHNLKENVFLFVGRLVQLKGIIHLVKSWGFLDLEDSCLLIVGDGPERENLLSYITTENIKNIHFQGTIDYDDIYKYFNAADIFVIPTLQDNWSLVVPEAMSCGLPIISSKYNGCWPELVKPENGWVFDPLDKNNFNETLELAFKNKEKWKNMGKASQKIVEDFSPDKIASQIYDSCKKVTSSN
tara:strand:+ start:116 stop:1288 length:1173 start_codon:yes stop_codon:yes gene_type:complete